MPYLELLFTYSTEVLVSNFVLCAQVWVKPVEVLARDRLLGSYKVSAHDAIPSTKILVTFAIWQALNAVLR